LLKIKSRFKFSLVTLIAAAFLLQPLPAAAVDEFTTVTGTISPPTGFSLLSSSVMSGGNTARADESGFYSITVPKNRNALFIIETNMSPNSQGGLALFANWTRVVRLSSATVLNFQPPTPISISVIVVDGRDQPIPGASIRQSSNQRHDPYTDSSGQTWTGIQRFGSNGSAKSETGTFDAWLYPVQEFLGVSYADASRSSNDRSPDFALLATKTLKLCLPVNLPSSGRMPEGCFGEKKSLASQTGILQFQKAGSQVVIVSSGMAEGQYILLEDGKEASRFSLSDEVSSVVIEKRITGTISIRRMDAAFQSNLTIEAARGFLWNQNYNLGIVNPSKIEGAQAFTLTQVSKGMMPRVGGSWVSRESATTKFICTGTYGPGSSLSEKIDARKKAQAACEYAQRQDSSSEVSFWFQTKETQAPSYFNKVLVTVKGLEKSVEEGLG
jgi:hypothetical protein